MEFEPQLATNCIKTKMTRTTWKNGGPKTEGMFMIYLYHSTIKKVVPHCHQRCTTLLFFVKIRDVSRTSYLSPSASTLRCHEISELHQLSCARKQKPIIITVEPPPTDTSHKQTRGHVLNHIILLTFLTSHKRPPLLCRYFFLVPRVSTYGKFDCTAKATVNSHLADTSLLWTPW